MLLPASLVAPRRGRPRKFGRPAEPVTITLPDDVVQALRAVDPDLSRAIVRLTETSRASLVPRPPVELTHYGHSAVIVVTPKKVRFGLKDVVMAAPPTSTLSSLIRKLWAAGLYVIKSSPKAVTADGRRIFK